MTTNWFEGVISGRNLGFSTETRDILLLVRQAIAGIHSDMAVRGKLSPVTYIYYSKNFFGMTDKKDVEINVTIGQKSAAQLLSEAALLPQEDDAIPVEAEETKDGE